MFNEWIKRPGVERCYLLEASYLLDGQPQKLHLSTHPYRSHGTDTPAYIPYFDYIVDLGEFDRQMSELFSGQSTVASSDIELYLHPEDIEPLLTTADFGGQPVSILCGDPAWPRSEFVRITSGALAESLTAASENTARLKLRDRASLFEQDILTATYESGPSEGRLLPRVYGTCFNIKPELIDPVTQTYQVDAGPVASIAVVREDGQSVPFTTDLAAGTFTLENAAQGTVTCDVTGLQTTSQGIVNHLLAQLGVDAISNPSAWPEYQIGLYLNSDSRYITFRDVFDAISRSVGGAWFFNRFSEFVLYRYSTPPDYTGEALPDVQDQIEDSSLQPRRRLAPVKSLKLGYGRNWHPTNQLAGVVRETLPDLATRLQSDHRYITGTNSGTSSDAQDITTDTLLVNQADAHTELNRRLALSANAKFVFELNVISTPFAYNLGDIISIDYPQYFSGGQNVVITRIADELSDDRARIEVLR